MIKKLNNKKAQKKEIKLPKKSIWKDLKEQFSRSVSFRMNFLIKIG